MSRKTKSRLFVGAMMGCLAVSFGTLAWLLGTTLVDGLPALSKALFTDPPSTQADEAGARPAILATIYLAALLLLMAVPIGVLTAIYLEEYAHKERWYNRLLELNIQNLAAVPAIVYGILGLAFVVRGPVGIGRVLLAGAIILTLVVLPTVIIASREAIRAVPDSIRQGGYALGATKWQVVSRQVLPASIPGIATGSILALSRAVGETMIVLIAVGQLPQLTFDPRAPMETLTAFIGATGNGDLPTGSIEYKTIFAVGATLFVGTLIMNMFAIRLVRRYREVYD